MIMGSGLYRARPDTGLGAASSAGSASPAASACRGPDGGAAGRGLSGVFRRPGLPMGRRADGCPASAANPGNATGRRDPGRLRVRSLAARGLAAVLLAAFAALLALPLQAQAQTIVPNDWSLIPSGLGPGDQFRLIFLSSTTRDGSSTDIAVYNTFIQNAAAAGHADIQAYSGQFRVVGCTASVDARDNTGTTGTGVPIYWLGGNKVADHYADFYNGNWDDEVNNKNELGTYVTASDPLTGCDHDGTENFSSTNVSGALGRSFVSVGQLNESGSGPIGSNVGTDNDDPRPMYGLSPLFQVWAPKPDVTISAPSPSVPYALGYRPEFTVTRTGATTNALTVTVNLRQDKPFLDESELLREVTIAAGSTSCSITPVAVSSCSRSTARSWTSTPPTTSSSMWAGSGKAFRRPVCRPVRAFIPIRSRTSQIPPGRRATR